ncbi:hypothetical protein [Deinococcus aquatilis]|uniref:hypothetical protein n=1 Tax=Deinococcus aquatilis TaxID=519440 RepID=UPI001B7FE795|nr:hypothetical protein [Deinococcus aquatilis]
MIRTLLDPHDHERQTNKLGHQRTRPSKLYLETRVLQVEATEAFAQARERASVHQATMVRAHQTRQARDRTLVERYESLALPSVRVFPSILKGTPSPRQDLWQLHLQEFYLWQAEQDHLILGVSQATRKAARRRMLERYQTAVDRAYGWPNERAEVPARLIPVRKADTRTVTGAVPSP